MENIIHECDLCVVGGGLAGMCAAISAARLGQRVVLMQERPMLGGNASSEIRMWVCGANGNNNRVTGVLEEIQLKNYYINPYKLYPVWDTLLYEKVKAEENITLLLNCSCCDAVTDGDTIVSVKGWQLTTQKWHTVKAKYFSDCSGDSILAPLTGAKFRVGREAKSEFNESKVTLDAPDKMTMGMSCLILGRKLNQKVKFVAPSWARKVTEKEMKRRGTLNPAKTNYWWLELGGDRDSIGDTEEIRDDLLALAYGIWDYFKNSGKYGEDADYWQIDFLSFLPGKRESRRMVGPYIMTSDDILDGGRFDDTVAYGGWTLDDHEPHGFDYDGPPNTHYPVPTPYGIPYRALYSCNINNLFFAGRNISMTHMAMSSSRVMATCALCGQAVGTAAAIASKYGTSPNGVYAEHIRELQETLMYNDCFIPYRKREISDVCKKASLCGTSTRAEGNIENLRNGIDRNNHTYGDAEQGFFTKLGATVEYSFAEAQYVNEARIIFDSDLCRDTIPGSINERELSMRSSVSEDDPVMHMPTTLIKEYRVEVTLEDGSNLEVYSDTNNLRRFILIPIGRKITSLRLTPTVGWGCYDAHIFSFDFN